MEVRVSEINMKMIDTFVLLLQKQHEETKSLLLEHKREIVSLLISKSEEISNIENQKREKIDVNAE